MTVKEFSKRIVVNDLKVTTKVTIEVHEEEDHSVLMDQDFENAEQESKYRAKVESGSIFAGYIVVTACAEGLEGIDSLGGCELKPNNMFNSKPFNTSVNFYIRDHGMIENALNELKKNLESEYARLSATAQKYKRFSK